MNILLTSVGRRSYLVQYFKDVLGNTGYVHVGNSSRLSPAFRVADRSVVTPLIYDPKYISFIINYCKAENIQLVLSLFDIDLPVLAAHKSEFEEAGIHLIVSDLEVVQICNDKWRTFCFLKEKGFSVPLTCLTLDEADCARKDGSLSYPVMIKPRWGMGSLSIYSAQDGEELHVLYKKCRREIEKSYLSYEAKADPEHAVIIQEMIQGDEFGLDVINDLSANYQTTIVKKKVAMRSGETDCAQIVEVSELEQLGERIAKTLGHIANLDMDILYQGNIPYIIDLNARFGGGYPYSHMAGVNLPKAILKWAEGECVNQDILTPLIGGCYGKDIVMTEIEISGD